MVDMAQRAKEEEQEGGSRRSDLGDDPLDPTAGAGRVRASAREAAGSLFVRRRRLFFLLGRFVFVCSPSR